MKRALVVGGTGFIGLAVVDALLTHGVQVRVSRRRRSITTLVRKRSVELVRASLDEPDALEEAMQGCDAVFLAAGHYPRYSLDLAAALETGVGGVRNACTAAARAGVPRLVYTSSAGSLAPAPPGRPADERDVPEQRPEGSVYRALKWAMEREVEAHAAAGLSTVTLLPGGCFGPGDLRVGTGGILVGAVRGMLPWYVEGLVPAVDVADVAAAHVAAALLAEPAPRYCVAGHCVTVSMLLRTIVGRFGGRVPELCLGAAEAQARADEDERRAAPRNQRVPIPRELVDIVVHGQPISSALAARELGFEARPLEQTLDRAHAWFARHGFLPGGPRDTRTTEAGALRPI